MTQCNQATFEFEAHFSRGVKARFDGGTMTSDGGALLLRQTDRRMKVLARLAECFEDRRKPWLITHRVAEMVAQRVYALALGYEDLSDHDQLREDPLLAVLSGKRRVGEEALAGKRTLNRWELSTETPSRYKKIHCRQEALDDLLVTIFIEAHEKPPESIVLDLDVTDLPLHGHQEGRFFHGYYDQYCYLPLYIFAGEHWLSRRPVAATAGVYRRAALANGRSGRRGRMQARGGADRRSDPAGLAGGGHHHPRRLGFLPGGSDAMVRRPRRRLRAGLCAQRPAAAPHRSADAGSGPFAERIGETSAGLHRVSLPDHYGFLEPGSAGGGQG